MSAMAAGVGCWILLHKRWTSFKELLIVLLMGLLVGVGLIAADFGSFQSAWIDGRFKIWLLIAKTWMFDTSGALAASPDLLGFKQRGPFSLNTFLTGHGLDSFLYLFPVMKHDANPFAQAHNCWLQLLWETGLLGVGLFLNYFLRLVRDLYYARQYLLLSGLACISVNALSAFPTRMIQTGLLMVAFFALCERNRYARNRSLAEIKKVFSESSLAENRDSNISRRS